MRTAVERRLDILSKGRRPAAIAACVAACAPATANAATSSAAWHADPIRPFQRAPTRAHVPPAGALAAMHASALAAARRRRSSAVAREGVTMHHVVVKLGNADDIEGVFVNGALRGTAGYDEYQTIDLGRLRSTDQIELQADNDSDTYSWGFDVIVDGADVYHDWAGTVSGYGANDNDHGHENQVVYANAFQVGEPPGPPPADGSGLSSQWCGGAADAARGAHRTARVPRIKLVYAYPSDRPDHFARYAQLIESDAQAVSDKVRDSVAEALSDPRAPPLGDVKGVRFDTGTSCGRQYVSIARVRLSKPQRYWLSGCARGDRLFAAAAEVRRALAGRSRADRAVRPLVNYAVYADGFFGGRCLESGIAKRVDDPSPGWYNRANRGGRVALVSGGGPDAPPSGVDEFAEGEPIWLRRDTLLHEIMHTIGAVQDRARHATGLGHCTDGPDIMCYDDGGPRSGQTYPCGNPSSTVQLVDCNQNDYFKPGPGPLVDWSGKRMWNTYDSVFLCHVEACTRNVRPPRARLALSRHELGAGQSVAVDARASTPGAAAIAHYQWFTKRRDHRSHELKDLRQHAHGSIRLTKPGDYSVIVRVTDRYQSYSIARATVHVTSGGKRAAR